jgi:hypothetical protein
MSEASETSTITETPEVSVTPAQEQSANAALREFVKTRDSQTGEPKKEASSHPKQESNKGETEGASKDTAAGTKPAPEVPKEVPAPEVPKGPKPSELREARIKELKKEIADLKNRSAQTKDEMEKKVLAFEAEKQQQQISKITKDEFFSAAGEEGVPDKDYYQDLIQYYGKDVDTPEFDHALKGCQNIHGVMYTVLQFIDETPGGKEAWKALSPMAMGKAMRHADKIISEAKARKATPAAPPTGTQGAPAGATEPKKDIPKAVIAPDGNGDTPRGTKGMSPNEALKHFKQFGATGQYDKER